MSDSTLDIIFKVMRTLGVIALLAALFFALGNGRSTRRWKGYR